MERTEPIEPEARAFFSALKEHLRSYPSKSIDAPKMLLTEAAILAPVFWRQGEPWTYLTQRPMTLRAHPGQISFPGGRRETADLTLLHTALRETHEEIGIPPGAVEVLGQLGAMPTITSFFVTPFVGVIDQALPLTPNPHEIEQVIEAPLWRLRREKRHIFHADRPVFVWDDGRHAVWGATWRWLEQLVEHTDAIRGAR